MLLTFFVHKKVETGVDYDSSRAQTGPSQVVKDEMRRGQDMAVQDPTPLQSYRPGQRPNEQRLCANIPGMSVLPLRARGLGMAKSS